MKIYSYNEKNCSYEQFFQLVYKPSSVLIGHLSRRIVTETLKRYETSRANYMFQLLHQVGFTQPISLPNCWCALTAPFHPYRCKPAVYFCCTILKVAFSGRYPSLCPAMLGLSSSCDATDRLTLHILTLFYL